MQIINEELPVVLLITSKLCPHCTELRGDGIPHPSKPKFSVNFIKSLIKRRGIRKANFFVELFVESNSRNSQISQCTFYTTINYSNLSDLINSKAILTDENIGLGKGDMLIRISFKKSGINAMVEVNGILSDSPTLTKYYMEKFVWDNVPESIKELRRVVAEREPISQELISSIEDRVIKAQVYDATQHNRFYDDKRALDNILLNFGQGVFDMTQQVSSFVPLQIRDYEISYPSWLLISGRWWNKGLKNPDLSIFARKAGGNTYEENGRFKVRALNPVKITKFLSDYDDGEINLENPEILKNYFQL